MGQVRVLNTSNLNLAKVINVGIDPVALAVRPDGSELWVANHVSDSVSVIDTDAREPTQYHGDRDHPAGRPRGVVTDFDEPVGIAFASNQKAYVALSSRNRIAIVDADDYAVTGTLSITAQDPRAIAVRDGRLYVAAFESGNQSELSACFGAPNGTTRSAPSASRSAERRGEPEPAGRPEEHRRRSATCPTATSSSSTPRPTRSSAAGDPRRHAALRRRGRRRRPRLRRATPTRATTIGRQRPRRAAAVGSGGASPTSQNRIFRNRVTRIDCGGRELRRAARASSSSRAARAARRVPTPLATPYGIQVSDDGTCWW